MQLGRTCVLSQCDGQVSGRLSMPAQRGQRDAEVGERQEMLRLDSQRTSEVLHGGLHRSLRRQAATTQVQCCNITRFPAEPCLTGSPGERHVAALQCRRGTLQGVTHPPNR